MKAGKYGGRKSRGSFLANLAAARESLGYPARRLSQYFPPSGVGSPWWIARSSSEAWQTVNKHKTLQSKPSPREVEASALLAVGPLILKLNVRKVMAFAACLVYSILSKLMKAGKHARQTGSICPETKYFSQSKRASWRR